MKNNANRTRFFYQDGKLITLQTADHCRSIMRTVDVLLAEQQSGDAQTHGLLVTDDKGSVLQVQVKS